MTSYFITMTRFCNLSVFFILRETGRSKGLRGVDEYGATLKSQEFFPGFFICLYGFAPNI